MDKQELKNIIFAYNKLRGKIKENNLTQVEFSKAIGIGVTKDLQRIM